MKFDPIEKHVCGVKWAKRLQELGVRQNTHFQWFYDSRNDMWRLGHSDALLFKEFDYYFAAYTAQDFIDLFPKTFKLFKFDERWNFYCETSDMQLIDDEENLADIFARILITLINYQNESEKEVSNE